MKKTVQLRFLLCYFTFVCFFSILPFLTLHGSVLHMVSIVHQSDTSKIDQLNEKGWVYRNNYPDSTIFYSMRALQLGDSLRINTWKAKTLNYIGVAHRNLSNYSKAFEYYLEAFKLAEAFNDLEQKGYALINLGNLSLYQSDFEGALSYFMNAQHTATELGDTSMIAYCHLNIGRAYRSFAQYDKAEQELLKSLSLRQHMGDIQGVITIESDLGEVNRLRGDRMEALAYFEKSIEKARPLGNMGAVVYGLNNISLIYLELGLTKKAREVAKGSLDLAISTGLKNDVRKAMLTLSMIDEAEGNWTQALAYHKDYLDLDRKIFSEENVRKVERLRAQYENEKKEAENSYLREQATLQEQVISRQRLVIALAGFGFFLLVIVAVITYYAFLIKSRLSKKIEAQKEKIEFDKGIIEEQAKKLEEIDRAKSRFFANISHDLRSPLSLILGNIENIKVEEENYLTPRSLRDLEVIERNSRRLLYMTDEINDLTRLEEGKINLKREIVELSPYIELMVAMFQSAASYKGVTLTFHPYNGQNLTVEIDPRQFEKIIYNLVSNAIKHCISGQTIDVHVIEENNKAAVVVEDSGEGIHAQSLPYIFDRFYQAPDKKFHAREGLGIGLALVKELVELHEGHITVTSQQGKGTKFVVFLEKAIHGKPTFKGTNTEYFSARQELLSESERIAFNSRRKVDLTQPQRTKGQILIVEDHPEIRQYIKELLESDYAVLEAGDGKEALNILLKEPIDLIITDLMMPIMDGFELIERITDDENLSHIPVLVVSARSSEKDKEKVLHTGVNDFLQKPFNKSELVLRVQNLMQAKTKLDQGKEKDIIQEHVHRVDSIEKVLLSKIQGFLISRIKEENLSVSQLAEEMAASERQVYRMVKKLTKMTPNEYIREFKLQFANELIKKGKVKTSSEAAREVGIKNVTQFSKNFEAKYGYKPSDLLVNDQK